ncbi:MAG: hypothetical protein FWG55_08625 [Candidatus Bathyarchaeota archaeon]|nr:hypothetical protein [Candidatus Termiticorpusculum sp.]
MTMLSLLKKTPDISTRDLARKAGCSATKARYYKNVAVRHGWIEGTSTVKGKDGKLYDVTKTGIVSDSGACQVRTARTCDNKIRLPEEEQLRLDHNPVTIKDW